jgi:hypothetical protein
MAILRVVWATHYLRWVAILGATAGAHAVAFCIYVGGAGRGGGVPVPEGRITLYLAQTEPPSDVRLTPVRAVKRPDDLRPVPVEVTPPPCSPERVLFTPPMGNPCALRPMSALCSLPQAPRIEARAVTANGEPRPRIVGAVSREVDQPLSIGDRFVPPRVVPFQSRAEAAGGSGAASGTFSSASKQDGRGSPQGHLPPSFLGGAGVEADFALDGKPVYPIECRRGDCNGRAPCEGVSRWRVVVNAPHARPVKIKRLQSSGCARLDASVEAFLRNARIPKAGVFVIPFRFVLDGR